MLIDYLRVVYEIKFGAMMLLVFVMVQIDATVTQPHHGRSLYESYTFYILQTHALAHAHAPNLSISMGLFLCFSYEMDDERIEYK